MTDRRFIEESFPVKEVGEISAKEKNIRHGHISTLHIWWARRPLAASRATAYAALTPAPKDAAEWQKRRDFIIELSKWENSLNQSLLEKARWDILKAHAERLSQELGEKVTVEDIEAGKYPRPRVLDPFAGGGSYPLEALRLGCEAYANDYNPVAVLIEKATLEYPQKFGRPFEGMPEWAYSPGQASVPTISKAHADQSAGYEATPDKSGLLDKPRDFNPIYGASPLISEIHLEPSAAAKPSQPLLFDGSPDDEKQPFNPLLNAVRYWGEWVLEEARKELAEFYPPDPDGSIPVGYIWARTLPCQNPTCGAEIPLMRQFWLAKKERKQIALRPLVHGAGQPIAFEIIARGKDVRGNEGYHPWPESFDPERGTVARAVVACPACGAVMDDKTTRRLFREGKSGQRLVAVVLHPPVPRGGRGAGDEGGKRYRLANESDLEAYRAAAAALEAKRAALRAEWGLEPVPDEPLPPRGTLGFRVQGYGIQTWGDLFAPRQQLALLTFAEAVRRAHAAMLAQGADPDFARAVATYLTIGLDRLATYVCTLTRWRSDALSFERAFDRQALPMVWDYGEVNPYSETRGKWDVEGIMETLIHLAKIPLTTLPQVREGHSGVTHASATRLPYPDGFFDAVLTDPPYYDNVPYSYLSDFFYVWLKRTLGHLYPELFSTPLTPKAGEIVAYSHEEGGLEAGMRFFEEQLAASFREIARLLKPGGGAVIVYAHKSTAGWETVINALLDSGLVVSAAWPLNTEMQTRLRANESATLASSIYIVARKLPRRGVGFYHEVRRELENHLNAKLTRLWEEGIGGADFFIAAIGSAIEVFGKYEQVIDLEGNVVRADRLLEDVRTIATDYAVRQILHNGFAGEISALTRLYVLWRWNYGEARVPFDEARKLAQSCGVDIAQAWSRSGYIQKEKEFVRLLGPQNRKLEDLDNPRDLIDVLHKTLLLWERGKRAEMIQALAERGHGRSEAFYRVAQAISETLPNESKEKKLLDGFLAGRERVQEEVARVARQERLWD